MGKNADFTNARDGDRRAGGPITSEEAIRHVWVLNGLHAALISLRHTVPKELCLKHQPKQYVLGEKSVKNNELECSKSTEAFPVIIDIHNR